MPILIYDTQHLPSGVKGWMAAAYATTEANAGTRNAEAIAFFTRAKMFLASKVLLRFL